MSNNDTQKADQIAFHFYTKLFYVVNDARTTAAATSISSSQKVDKWFNLEVPDSDSFTKENREPYKSTTPPPPPLEIQVLLSIPELTNGEILVYRDTPSSTPHRVQPTPRHIMLENWVLKFSPGQGMEELPTIYKNGITLFRSLYSLLRVLPAWKLCKKLRRAGPMSLRIRVKDLVGTVDVLDFGTPPAPTLSPLATQTRTFAPVPHPTGTLTLSCTYLSTPNFELSDRESYLSQNLLNSPDAFTPTLVKNHQRDSITGSSMRGSGSPAGSLPIRTSLPRSPPKDVADRFIIPSRGTPSGAPSTSPRNVPLPGSRPFPATGSAGTGSNSNSGSLISNWGDQPSVSLASRLRKQSNESSSPLARRPSINPFKSNTLSNSSLASSLRQGSSPLGGVRFPVAPTPPSPIGIGSSAATGGKPSPSSAGEESAGSAGRTRKRYSSSFGHRYSNSGGGGTGSDGGSDRGKASYTDEEGLSSFVQDIDGAKPLRRTGQPSPSPPSQSRPPSSALIRRPLSQQVQGGEGMYALGGLSPPGAAPILTTESEVDSRLKKMNDEFMRSLQGLGSERGASSSSPRPRRTTSESHTRRTTSESDSSGASTSSGRTIKPSTPQSGLKRDLIRYTAPPSSSPLFGSTGSEGLGAVQGSEEVVGRLDGI